MANCDQNLLDCCGIDLDLDELIANFDFNDPVIIAAMTEPLLELAPETPMPAATMTPPSPTAVPSQALIESSRPVQSEDSEHQMHQKLAQFSRPHENVEGGPSNRKKAGKEPMAVVDPAGNIGGGYYYSTGEYDQLMSSSTGSATGANTMGGDTTAEDRKRKERGRRDGGEDQSQQAAQASSARKRSRAAEVHNRSERRRRVRINEKMRALQQLIPNCDKKDRASMLDEVIDYVKMLQLQIQNLTMGCGSVPRMHPDTAGPYPPAIDRTNWPMASMPAINGPNMSRPTSQFSSTLQNQAATVSVAQTSPVPDFRMPVSPNDQLTNQQNSSDLFRRLIASQMTNHNPNQRLNNPSAVHPTINLRTSRN